MENTSIADSADLTSLLTSFFISASCAASAIGHKKQLRLFAFSDFFPGDPGEIDHGNGYADDER
jgi:hypothetical protein